MQSTERDFRVAPALVGANVGEKNAQPMQSHRLGRVAALSADGEETSPVPRATAAAVTPAAEGDAPRSCNVAYWVITRAPASAPRRPRR